MRDKSAQTIPLNPRRKRKAEVEEHVDLDTPAFPSRAPEPVSKAGPASTETEAPARADTGVEHTSRTDRAFPERNPTDIYALVTDRIMMALENGTVPWKKPWATGLPRNLVSGRHYRGMNVLLLSLGQPFQSPYWLTFKQALDLGGHVRKGERGSIVTFWKFHEVREEQSEDGGPVVTVRERPAPLLRYYTVFNAEQVEGIEVPTPETRDHPPHERIERCEAILSAMPNAPEVLRDPNKAAYSPVYDTVTIPHLEQFDSAESYYGTLFHELVHSTGHASRLDRPTLGTPAPFGSEDYSREELVAEMGAAFLAAEAGIFPPLVDNQAAYIRGWLSVLKGDKRMIPVAAAQAQRAADFILGVLPNHSDGEA